MPNEIYHRSEWGNPKAEGFGDVYFDASATNKLYKHSDYYENSDGTDKILRDIPNKASIVLTPTAYSDGSLNTVLPEYSEEEKFSNSFDTLETGWSYNNNILTGVNTPNNAISIFNIPIDYKFKVSFKVNDLTGILFFKINNTSLSNTVTLSNGVYEYEGTVTGSNPEIKFDGAGSTPFSGYITDISIKEIQEADFDFSRGSSATRVNEKGLIEDVASGIPRIDYTSGQGALLLEPQSTNLITYSEDFTQWTLGSNSTLTYESDVVAPDGSLGVYRLQLPATNNTYITSNSFTGVNPLSVSIYVKSAGQEEDDFNLYTGITPSEKFTATSEWKRFNYTLNGASFSIVNSGDTFASDIYIWGAQAGALSYATSYIPTSGSTVTRSAETANNSGNADLFNDSEGVLYAEMAALADTTSQEIAISLSEGQIGANRLLIRMKTNGVIGAVLRVANTTQASIDSGSLDQSTSHKIAVKYKLNDIALWIDGIEVGTDNLANVFPANTLDEVSFNQGNNSNNFYGNVKALAVFKEALTDAELESLTSWISFTEMATDLEYTLE